MCKMALPVLIFLLVQGIFALLPPQEYPYNVALNQRGALAEWRKVGDDRIEFQITAPTTGWFGFGFSPNGGMRGADMVIGWLSEDGQAMIEDRYATDFWEPFKDAQQDWTLEGSDSSEGVLKFRMSRKLETCDEPSDIAITDDTMRVIFSTNPKKPEKGQDGSWRLMKHVEATATSLFFFDTTQRVPSPPSPGETVSSHVFHVTEVEVPRKDTTYWCEVMEFPKFTNPDQYITGFEAAISPPENVDMVHHMLFYVCDYKINTTYPVKRVFECDADRESVQVSCQSLIGAWARGGQAVFFPDNVAFPVKQLVQSGRQLMMQMHYDNPMEVAGRRDATGIQMHFSDKQRLHDAASVKLGSGSMDYSLAIPPLEPEWTIRTECPNYCTKKKLPPTGVNFVMMALHTHLLGTKIIARHVRNGQEMAPLHKDENYDFNYQEFKSFPEPKVLLPDDTIIVDCVYSSTYPTRRNVTTFAGESTREEMCLVFGFYYPAADLRTCMTAPDPVGLAAAYGRPELVRNNTAMEEFIRDEYEWTPANKEKIRTLTREGLQYVGCYGDDSYDPTGFSTINGISKFTPYHEPSVCDATTTSTISTTTPTTTRPIPTSTQPTPRPEPDKQQQGNKNGANGHVPCFFFAAFLLVFSMHAY